MFKEAARSREETDVVRLPKLKVHILQAGEPLRVVEVEDPRERLIRNFNSCSQDLGLVAKPA